MTAILIDTLAIVVIGGLITLIYIAILDSLPGEMK